MDITNYLIQTGCEMSRKLIKVTNESMVEYMKAQPEEDDGDGVTNEYDEILTRFKMKDTDLGIFITDIVTNFKDTFKSIYDDTVIIRDRIENVIQELASAGELISPTTVLTAYCNKHPGMGAEEVNMDIPERIREQVIEYDEKSHAEVPWDVKDICVFVGIDLSYDLKDVTRDTILAKLKDPNALPLTQGASVTPYDELVSRHGEEVILKGIDEVVAKGKYLFDSTRLEASKCSVEVSTLAHELHHQGKEVTPKLVLATLAYKSPETINKYDETMISYAIARSLDQIKAAKDLEEYERNLHKEEK